MTLKVLKLDPGSQGYFIDLAVIPTGYTKV
jgi:hypothetical protein